MQSNEPAPASQPGEIVVFMVRNPTQCAECHAELAGGTMIRLERERALCLDCADLGHLVFLPSGNTALTRRASKYSPLRAVVVRWARARNRYERQGLLVAAAGLERAETECLADEDRRARQRERAAVRREHEDHDYEATVAQELARLFPGAPGEELVRIAAWTCRKHSGRVGRSAAAKALDPQALRLAVIAHIRHEHTPYDERLLMHGDRQLARTEVQPAIERVLARWESPGPTPAA